MMVGGRSVVSNTIDHYVELREPHERFFRLLELMGEWVEKGQILIFVERQDSCDELLTLLMKNGYTCCTLHGGMDQADRDSTLADYKNKVVDAVIATSLAALQSPYAKTQSTHADPNPEPPTPNPQPLTPNPQPPTPNPNRQR
jgi:ATP-dependent RNA helicase DDX46/PRP5